MNAFERFNNSTAGGMSCQQYHIKKWWFGLFYWWVQISGAYLLHPNIISTSTRFIPTKKDLEKRVKKITRKKSQGNKSTTNSITIFFPIWLSITPNTPTKTLPLKWEAWRENAINFPHLPHRTEHSHGREHGCGSEAKRLQPKQFHLGVQKCTALCQKVFLEWFFFLCTRNHPSKG